MRWAGDRRLCFAAALLISLAAPAVGADYKESYREGIKAVDREEWRAAARWMREAADEKGEEGETVRLYGSRIVPYLPHYYLGLALYRMGNCEGALAAWQTSVSQRAVRRTSRYEDLLRHQAVCEDRIKPAPAPTPPPQSPTLSPPPPPPPPIPTPRPDPNPAASQVEKPEKQPDADQSTPKKPAVEESPEERRRRAEAARRQELDREIERALREARPLLDRAGRVPSPGAELQRRQAILRDLLRRAEDAGSSAPLTDLERLPGEILSAADRLEAAFPPPNPRPDPVPVPVPVPVPDPGPGPRPVPARPPAELQAAARAYLRGDYPEVIRSLGTATFPEQRATAAANLLLGAAHHALYAQGGEKDVQLLRQAGENVRTCRRLAPRLVPDPKIFSPRFAAFFKTGG